MENVKNNYTQAVRSGMKDTTFDNTTTFLAEALACLGILMMLTIVLAPISILMYVCWYRKMSKLYVSRILMLEVAAVVYGFQPTDDDKKLDSGFSTMKIKDNSFKAKIYNNQECFWFWAPVMCEMDREEFKSLFTTKIGLEEEDYVNIFTLEARKLPDDMTSKQWSDIKKVLSVLSPLQTSDIGSSKTVLNDEQEIEDTINAGELLKDKISDLV